MTDRETRRIGEELRRLEYGRWQMPAGMTEEVLAERRARFDRQRLMEADHMRRRKLGLAAAAVFVCVVGIAAVASPSTFASIVEAGRRWFHFGADDASAVSIAEPQVEGQGRMVTVVAVRDGDSGDVEVVSTTEAPVPPGQMASDLEELEAGVAEGRYTVAKTRGPMPALAGDAPARECDIYTFSGPDGVGVAEVMADPETGSVIALSRSCQKMVCRDADAAVAEGSPDPQAGDFSLERCADGSLRIRMAPVEPIPAGL